MRPPGPRSNRPPSPMLRVPLTQRPTTPGLPQPNLRHTNLNSPPRFNIYQHRFPPMYLTLTRDLPRGTIVNLFHPASTRPIAVVPRTEQNTELFTAFYLPIDPPNTLVQTANPIPATPPNQPPQLYNQ
jgi:hypothetical protein